MRRWSQWQARVVERGRERASSEEERGIVAAFVKKNFVQLSEAGCDLRLLGFMGRAVQEEGV